MPQRRSIPSRWDEVAADRAESGWTRSSSPTKNNSQNRPRNNTSSTEASITRDRGTATTTGAPATNAGHFGTAARGQVRRSSTTTSSSQRRLGVFDSSGISSSSRRRHSTEGHLTGTSAGAADRGGASTSIRASFRLGGGPLSSSESEDIDAHTAGGGADNDNDTSDGVIYGQGGRLRRSGQSGQRRSQPHHERSSSGDDALLLEPDGGLDAYDSFRRAAQRGDLAAARSRRKSTMMSTDDEGDLDAPHLGDGSIPRINVNLSTEDAATQYGEEKKQQKKEGQVSGSSSSAGSGSVSDRRIQRRKSLELLNRNEAELMSHDFHYAEYLDMKQPPSHHQSNRSSLHSSKNSSYSYGSTTKRGSATPNNNIGGEGYLSTDDSARSYRRTSTTIAHSGSGGVASNSGDGAADSKNHDSGLHRSSYSSSAANSHRRQSYPPPQHYESDSSGLGGGLHRPPSSTTTPGASANANTTSSTPKEEEDSDDADYRRGRSVDKSTTKRERKRLSDHTTVPPLELGNSCFEQEGILKGGDTSSDETGTGGKFARRFSGHSMASINLIMPQMDDSEPDADDGQGGRQGNSRRKKRSGRGQRKDSSEQNKAPPPDDDLNPRWQGSMTDLMHASASSGTSRMRRSRSISPHRRHAIEDFNRSGNASTNFVEAADAARRWSGSDSGDGSSPGTGTKSRLSSLSGSEGNATPKDKTRIHRGGLKGMWSRVVRGNTSSRSGRRSASSSKRRSKSKERQQRGYGIDSPETNSGSSRSFGRITGGRKSRKVKHKTSDVETGRGVDSTDTGSLVGQGNLGDKMVVTGGKSRPNLPPSNKRRRVIFQCCMAVVLLILAFVLPLILKLPGLVPPRTAEVLEAKAKELFDRISSAASSPFVSSGEQYDDLGRPLSGLSVEDPTTLFEESIDAVRLQVPAPLHNLIDIDAPAPAEASGATVTPFLWHLDRSGSDVLEHVVATCLGQRVASDLAGNTKAQIYTTEDHLRVVSIDGGSYLNVDLSTMAGVDRGHDLGLLPSGLVDFVISPQFFYVSTELFDVATQGRTVCMFRDPVTRELENYQDLVDSIDQDISLEEYLREFDLQENLIVRTITGNEYKDVATTAEMLEEAKAIVRTKCLVGIYEQLAPSIARFEEYFGYGPIIDAPPSARPCIDRVRKNEERASRRVPKVEKGGPSYQTIMGRNQFDAELYEFAKVVWEEQGETLFERQRGGKTFRTMRLPASPGSGFRDHDVYAMNGH